MNKYERTIEKIEAEGQAKMKVFGNSMTPIIKSGSLLTYITADEYKKGDIVLCKVRGRWIDAHKVTKKHPTKGYMIANNHGWENGWTKKIFAKIIEINGTPYKQ